MPVVSERGPSHDAAMKIAAALRELFGPDTQTVIAARLTTGGLHRTDQTKVSAWLRGRVPDIEQMNLMESIYGRPNGWILHRAGFVDAEALTAARGDVVPMRRRNSPPPPEPNAPAPAQLPRAADTGKPSPAPKRRTRPSPPAEQDHR